jgi:hypothetical protein
MRLRGRIGLIAAGGRGRGDRMRAGGRRWGDAAVHGRRKHDRRLLLERRSAQGAHAVGADLSQGVGCTYSIFRKSQIRYTPEFMHPRGGGDRQSDHARRNARRLGPGRVGRLPLPAGHLREAEGTARNRLHGCDQAIPALDRLPADPAANRPGLAGGAPADHQAAPGSPTGVAADESPGAAESNLEETERYERSRCDAVDSHPRSCPWTKYSAHGGPEEDRSGFEQGDPDAKASPNPEEQEGCGGTSSSPTPGRTRKEQARAWV